MVDVFLVSCDFIEELGIDTETSILREALERRGIKTSLVTWEDESVDWGEAALAVNRIVTTYMFLPGEFLGWAKKVEKTTPLWNPSPVLEWNIHKKYLLELQEKGVSVPETMLIEQNTDHTIEEILDAVPWDDVVLKSSVGEGSAGLRRFKKDSPDLEEHFWRLNRDGYQQVYDFSDRVFEYPARDTLIQRYVPEIMTRGEVSLFYFGGNYSHAVLKMPRRGDFRAHSVWGAEVTHYSASERDVQTGFDSLDVVGHGVEFARIDMIPVEPEPTVIEVELIDPYFFFEFASGTVDLYADHIQRYLSKHSR